MYNRQALRRARDGYDEIQVSSSDYIDAHSPMGSISSDQQDIYNECRLSYDVAIHRKPHFTS